MTAGALRRRAETWAPPGSSVLVVKLSSIGDVVHTVPSVLALARALPGVAIDWVVEPPAAPLVAALPWVRRTVVSRLPEALRSGGGALREEAGRLLGTLREARYGLAVDFQGLLRSSLLSALSGARRRIGRGRWPWLTSSVPMYAGGTPHAVENTARALAPLGIPASAATDALPDAGAELARLLRPRGEVAATALGLRGGFWLWFPFARWASKTLPLDEALPAGGVHVVAGAPGDSGRAPRRPGVVDACGALDLLGAAGLALLAERVVAADTGPAHLASLLGAPVTGLYGPTRASATGLRGPRARSLEGGCGGCRRRRCARSRACLLAALSHLP